jgi:hypothetical protein
MAASFNLRVLEGQDLIHESLSHLFKEGERRPRFFFVHLRHGKADVDEDPVSRLHHFVFEQRDVDVALDPADMDRRQVILTRKQRDNLSWNAETHCLLLPEPGSRHLPFILNRLEDKFISANEINVYPIALRAF